MRTPPINVRLGFVFALSAPVVVACGHIATLATSGDGLGGNDDAAAAAPVDRPADAQSVPVEGSLGDAIADARVHVAPLDSGVPIPPVGRFVMVTRDFTEHPTGGPTYGPPTSALLRRRRLDVSTAHVLRAKVRRR